VTGLTNRWLFFLRLLLIGAVGFAVNRLIEAQKANPTMEMTLMGTMLVCAFVMSYGEVRQEQGRRTGRLEGEESARLRGRMEP
jgi:hypothetical protein